MPSTPCIVHINTQALLAREDQAGGRKKTGASLLTLFSGSSKLVGKLRIRLSTLPANTPLNLSMPLQGACGVRVGCTLAHCLLAAGPACFALAVFARCDSTMCPVDAAACEPIACL